MSNRERADSENINKSGILNEEILFLSLVMYFSYIGNVNLVRAFGESGHDLNAVSPQGNTAVMFAAAQGNIDSKR
jgi:ankyrin repeat protein